MRTGDRPERLRSVKDMLVHRYLEREGEQRDEGQNAEEKGT